MADKKISQLTGASTPLAGTEVLPIVQSGSTVKVSVDNLTKGKIVNATTFDTDVAAAGVTLTGTTLSADGTDTNIDINITPKGTGEVNITKVDIDGGTIDGTTIGGSSAAAATVTSLNTTSDVAIGTVGSKLTFDTTGVLGSSYIQTTNQFDLTIYNSRGGSPNIVLHNTDGIQFKSGTTLDISVKSGNLVIGTADKGIEFSGGLIWRTGTGTPEGAVTAPVGSLFTRTDGGANTTLYVKESGVGNTGWVAK